MRQVSRRSFLKFCTAAGAALGLDPLDITRLNRAMANPAGPTVLWLQGAGCTGCSESLLNYISPTSPTDAADVLINYINLAYHPNLSPVAGESAATVIQQVRDAGNFVLVIEGGVPTAFGGGACYSWTIGGVEVTFADAVRDLAARAAAIVCIGTCSSFGGIPAAGPNPAGVVSVSALTGKATVNIAGCPPHPDWMVWAIVQLIQGTPIDLDANGRPTAIFSATVHEHCPRLGAARANTYGVAELCLRDVGCHGPVTHSNCPAIKWNNGVNWCIGANALCTGCTEPTFPADSLYHGSY